MNIFKAIISALKNDNFSHKFFHFTGKVLNKIYRNFEKNYKMRVNHYTKIKKRCTEN